MTALVDTSASSWDRTSTQNTTIISISTAASVGCASEVALDVPRAGRNTQPLNLPVARRPRGYAGPSHFGEDCRRSPMPAPHAAMQAHGKAWQTTIGDDHETDR